MFLQLSTVNVIDPAILHFAFVCHYIFDLHTLTDELLVLRFKTHSKAFEFSQCRLSVQEQGVVYILVLSCVDTGTLKKIDLWALGQLHPRQMSVWPLSKDESMDSSLW